ncbi:leucine-rich repeat-containing protein 51-like [Acyrthosiphon pisum]|uniref:Leucine-rich repeat-containing protein 51 n=1 Tax=Acyrthosiphon pisum TaxID=7029 RepID=A0A8R2F9P4_ACYPI|nr:leucine-rich repeat-containing protein 51-like [Acyrthosiphon pisum]|eukprot:XP_008184285.1 PREDICTED: leucine-rich repeat-containing protein 51-like [Acyrthosiphon pisum]
MKSMKVPFLYKRAKPLDLSFEDLESLEPSSLRVFSSGFVSSYRMLGVPAKRDGRYKTASLLLSHNRLTGGLDDIRLLVDRLFWQPNALCWLDLSHNQLTDLSDVLLGFPNLSTLYLHHNRLASLCAVVRINRLPRLRSVTLQNNPVAEYRGYRTAVLSLLKRITRLDFVSVTESERRLLPPIALESFIKNYLMRQKS